MNKYRNTRNNINVYVNFYSLIWNICLDNMLCDDNKIHCFG